MRNARRNANAICKFLEGEKITLFDIGSRRGVHQRWNRFGSYLRVVGFEPDEKECERLNRNAASYPYEFRCLPYALGREAQGPVDLYICTAPGCSSIYHPNSDFVREFYFGPDMNVVDVVPINLNTLQRVAEDEQLVPDYIKIDTQGSELDILEGGLGIVKDAKMLEIEVEFNLQYRDQPLFSNVDLWLRDAGFLLLGLRRTYWRRINRNKLLASPFGGQLIHGDAIYYNSRLTSNLRMVSPKDLVKFCIMLSAYRQDDFVTYLMENEDVVAMSRKDRTDIASLLLNRRALFSALPFGRSHVKLRRTLDMLRSKNAVDWHDPEFF